MKKFLFVAAMVAGFSNLFASAAEWEFDLDNSTATHRVGETVEVRAIVINMDSFGSAATRSVDSLMALFSADALANQEYKLKRRVFVQVEGVADEIPLVLDYLLQFTETVTTDKHAHYRTGINTPSGANDVVVRYPVYECTQTTTVVEILAKLADAPAEVEPFLLATETIVGAHVPGAAVLKDGSPWTPTNPAEQTYGSGIITADPNGVGEPQGNAVGTATATANVVGREFARIGKQAENLGKKIGKKLGFRK